MKKKLCVPSNFSVKCYEQLKSHKPNKLTTYVCQTIRIFKSSVTRQRELQTSREDWLIKS